MTTVPSMNTLQQFRKIAITEGVSYLLLLFVAMPIKYFGGIPEFVTYIGWAHGVLFVLYVVCLFIVRAKYHWSFKKFFLAGLASLLPFGPFILDRQLIKEAQSKL